MTEEMEKIGTFDVCVCVCMSVWYCRWFLRINNTTYNNKTTLNNKRPSSFSVARQFLLSKTHNWVTESLDILLWRILLFIALAPSHSASYLHLRSPCVCVCVCSRVCVHACMRMNKYIHFVFLIFVTRLRARITKKHTKCKQGKHIHMKQKRDPCRMFCSKYHYILYGES